MELRKVLSNRDPLKMGRILAEDGWLSPIAQLSDDENHKLFWVPAEGTYVVKVNEFYIGSKLEDIGDEIWYERPI